MPVDDWSAPGVFEVAPGVHRIPLPLPNDGLRAVNIYTIVDDSGVTLIDAGWAIPEARELLAAGLASLGYSFGDVSRFLVTHIHRDHYTQAVAIRREFGTRVALGAGERQSLELIQAPTRLPLEQQMRQMRRLGAAEIADLLGAGLHAHDDGERPDWQSPDDWLVPGELPVSASRTLQVIETPGHTRGHVVFRDASNALLFAGDHVLPTITPSIGLEPVLSPDPLGDFLRSLALVRSLPDTALLPAHGPVAPSVHRRVDELVEHHGRRLEQTAAALARGADTPFAVAGELRWTRRETKLADLDLFNQMLAVGETAAHLDLLLARGEVTRTTVEGVNRYSLA